MGSSFTSICIKTSRTVLKSALHAVMKERGFRTDNKTPEIHFSITPCGKNWCCLKGDYTDSEEFSADLSTKLNVPLLVAECVDSDFICFTLHHDGQTDIACAGNPYDEDPPSPNGEFWQNLTDDFESFISLLSQKRVFAEDILSPLGEMMGFNGEALLPSDEETENVFDIGFSHVGEKISPLITSGPTRLGRQYRYGANPYRLDTNSTVSIHNYGGPSKGLELIVEAVFPDRRDLSFEIHDAHIRSLALQINGIGAQPMPAEFECTSREPGCSIWRAVFPDFQIPEGINPEYKFSSWKQEKDIVHARCIVFNYRLQIPEHLSELNIHFIPLEYPEGLYVWRLEDCWITPQEQEIFDREGSDAFHEYLRKKNILK